MIPPDLGETSALLKLKETQRAAMFRGVIVFPDFRCRKEGALRWVSRQRVVIMCETEKVRTDEDSEHQRRNAAV